MYSTEDAGFLSSPMHIGIAAKYNFTQFASTTAGVSFCSPRARPLVAFGFGMP
eukprot:m.121950 g.121950  ORF g.121950 m.121950 type:complete len:53 (+) comp28891_c1_seq1:909-1067(+)